MKKDFFDMLNFCLAFFIVSIIILVVTVLAYIATGKAKIDVIQELCSKNQYDFCEVDRVVYKYKEQGR